MALHTLLSFSVITYTFTERTNTFRFTILGASSITLIIIMKIFCSTRWIRVNTVPKLKELYNIRFWALKIRWKKKESDYSLTKFKTNFFVLKLIKNPYLLEFVLAAAHVQAKVKIITNFIFFFCMVYVCTFEMFKNLCFY